MNCPKITALLILILGSSSAFAEIRLPKMISNGMVMQRNAEITIWGRADPGVSVKLGFKDAAYQTTADERGAWDILLPPFESGGPYTMEIMSHAPDTLIAIEDIMIGEVWVASGQSNMELPMERVAPLYGDEISRADYPRIRHFEVPKTYEFDKPEDDLTSGNWLKVNSDNVHKLSAVAHFFSRHLHEEQNIAIGIINSSMGGSPVEAWMSKEALAPFPEHYNEAMRFRNEDLIRQIEESDQKRISRWHQSAVENDAGYQGPDPWYANDTDDTDWNTMSIPGYWAGEDPGDMNGVVWFRKEIQVPREMAEKPADLELGRIVDADSTFLNGVFVGNTTYQYPPRWYDIPEGLLKEGKNIITVRVTNERGQGGFFFDKPYELTTRSDTIDLRGEWKYKVGVAMEPLESQTFIRWKPMGLYNAMIAPLLNYTIKGVIWYQGESNTGRPREYRELFPAMIDDWRVKWNQGNFPFLFVQLANFMEPSKKPTDSNWARLREAQKEALRLDRTGMAVAIDIGEWNDIHPLNKKDVGDRLALAARGIAYKEQIVYSGPVYRDMRIERDQIHLSFGHTGSGLKACGAEELHHFAIAGKDREFVLAQAEIDGDQVIVSSDRVRNPVAVRYAWADNPDTANLCNREGLPAAPFRTDNW